MVSFPVSSSPRLLIAASGTGGHLFPALAVAEALPDYDIEWLGVPDRLETQLVGDRYPLHTIAVTGFQQKLGLGTLKIAGKLVTSIFQVRRLLSKRQFQGILTTGGYIAAPAIVAARSLGLPVILHESNALPGKVTRWFGPWCTQVALGVASAQHYLPRSRTVFVGTPVRSTFLTPPAPLLDFPIPDSAQLLVVVGGSQGALAVNKLVRQAAPAWLEAGLWIVHLTGDNDPDRLSLQHPHYFSLPFYDQMAALLHRADLAISRAGAGTLIELAITQTPAILIPYPYAAEDHQTYNAQIFAEADAALMVSQEDLTSEQLKTQVLNLLTGTEQEHCKRMAANAAKLAVRDSADRLADQIRQLIPRFG